MVVVVVVGAGVVVVAGTGARVVRGVSVGAGVSVAACDALHAEASRTTATTAAVFLTRMTAR